MSDFWKNLGKKDVQVFDTEEEIEKKKKKKRLELEKSKPFEKLRGALKSDDRSLAELATQARKDVTKKGFWDK